MASPSFKLRFMFMTDYDDEDEFDTFAAAMDLRPTVPAITCPVLIIAGEEDQLSPIECSYELFEHIEAAKEILVYEGANHSVAEAPSVALGEHPRAYLADWLAARLDGKPVKSVKAYVDSTGRRTETPV